MTTHLDQMAELRHCTRCPNMATLTPGGCFADCVADMGLRRPDEHSAWLGRVKDETHP
jgi:hypothetical protein